MSAPESESQPEVQSESPSEPKLVHPWLVAVWPGMGNVAMSAGYYLMAKLDMHGLAELTADELFDVEHIEVRGGLIRPGRLPRNRFYVWHDPQQRHDIVVFIGEAQPPLGKYTFCRKLIRYAQELGVERVFTFAAMATQMHPERHSRVFAAATDDEMLSSLKELGPEMLDDGNIGGLNGVLLGVAAEQGMRGACLLGEMPHILAQLPFPKASQAVLEIFAQLADIQLDMTELGEQVRVMDEKLSELMSDVERAMGQQQGEEEESFDVPAADENKLSPEDEARIEDLFSQAQNNRTKAYELKRELDNLNVFKDYEDRFLDLFKKS